MARPSRNNIDYFPHECVHGRKMFVIESKYGNDGYAVWFKLLERLGDTDNHYLNLSDETELMYLASLMKVDENKFKNILNDLAKLGAIDKELYEENKIIWSQKFYESIQDAYNKRNNKCLDRNSLVLLLISLGIRKPNKSSSKPSKSTQSSDINPQRIEEDIKEEENIHPLRLFVFDNFTNVSKMKTQLTNENCIELIERFKKPLIHEKLLAMENTAQLTKKNLSVYLTLINWCSKENKTTPLLQTDKPVHTPNPKKRII